MKRAYWLALGANLFAVVLNVVTIGLDLWRRNMTGAGVQSLIASAAAIILWGFLVAEQRRAKWAEMMDLDIRQRRAILDKIEEAEAQIQITRSGDEVRH